MATLRRRETMRAVIASAQEHGDTSAPWRRVEAVDSHFANDDDLLVELHREWLRVLVGRLHRGSITHERTPGNVRDLYDEVTDEHPTLRRILDANRANPVLWEPMSAELSMIARLAGLTEAQTAPEEAASQGRLLVTQRVPSQRSTLG